MYPITVHTLGEAGGGGGVGGGGGEGSEGGVGAGALMLQGTLLRNCILKLHVSIFASRGSASIFLHNAMGRAQRGLPILASILCRHPMVDWYSNMSEGKYLFFLLMCLTAVTP